LAPLHIAALQGSESCIKALLDLKAMVNISTSDGATPAIYAAGSGHLQALKELARNKIDLSCATSSGDTPAFQAAEHGHSQVLLWLWRQGADIDRPALRGATPLYIAAQNGHTDVVRVLVVAQVDLNRMAFGQATPLAVAAQEGHYTVASLLIKSKADPDKGECGYSPAAAASLHGRSAVLSLLFKRNRHWSEDTLNNQSPSIQSRQGDATNLTFEEVAGRTCMCIPEVLPSILHSKFQDLVRARNVDGTLCFRTLELEAAKERREAAAAKDTARAKEIRTLNRMNEHDEQEEEMHVAKIKSEIEFAVEQKQKADLEEEKLQRLLS